MYPEVIYNDLGEVTKLKLETDGLCGGELDRVIINDVFSLKGVL